MPWSGEMENLRKKNAAAKLKASLAEEVVDLSGQIEDDEDSDDIAADEVSVRELPNDPWKKQTNSATAPQFIPVETMKEVVNQAAKGNKPSKKTSNDTNSDPTNPYFVPKEFYSEIEKQKQVNDDAIK